VTVIEFSKYWRHLFALEISNWYVVALIYFSFFGCIVAYGDNVDNTVEENSSVFSLVQMCWLLSARACVLIHQFLAGGVS